MVLISAAGNQDNSSPAIICQVLVILQVLPLFFAAACSLAEIPYNEQQKTKTCSNQCWKTGAGWEGLKHGVSCNILNFSKLE